MSKQVQQEKTEVEKEMIALKEAATQKEEIRLTPAALAARLSSDGKIDLSPSQVLVLTDMDVSDFLIALGTSDVSMRLQVFGKILQRFSLDVMLEGSVVLGEFNISEHSWRISAGNSGHLIIKAKPSLVRRSVSELVSFLNMLPLGQGFVLKPSQDLLLEGLSSDSMLDYYQFCQENQDARLREKGQDELFEKNCQTLSLKGLSLKIFGINASQVDRGIDVNAGGILFRAIPSSDAQKTALVAVLLAKEKKAE